MVRLTAVKPVLTQTRQTAELEWQNVPKGDPRTEPYVERFATVFSAARGTVSPEFDLNGFLDDPVVTAEDAGAKPRRLGS